MNVFSWAAAMGHQWGKPDGCTRQHSKHTNMEDWHRWDPLRPHGPVDETGPAERPRAFLPRGETPDSKDGQSGRERPVGVLKDTRCMHRAPLCLP